MYKSNKSAEVRDFHNPQAIMTVMDTPIACAVEAPPRRKEWTVHLTPGGVGMSSSTKRRNSHSVMIPELLNHDGGSSSRDQCKSVSRWAQSELHNSKHVLYRKHCWFVLLVTCETQCGP